MLAVVLKHITVGQCGAPDTKYLGSIWVPACQDSPGTYLPYPPRYRYLSGLVDRYPDTFGR
jgi:hypothetical protein